jgi:hypothetical protein
MASGYDTLQAYKIAASQFVFTDELENFKEL